MLASRKDPPCTVIVVCNNPMGILTVVSGRCLADCQRQLHPMLQPRTWLHRRCAWSRLVDSTGNFTFWRPFVAVRQPDPKDNRRISLRPSGTVLWDAGFTSVTDGGARWFPWLSTRSVHGLAALFGADATEPVEAESIVRRVLRPSSTHAVPDPKVMPVWLPSFIDARVGARTCPDER